MTSISLFELNEHIRRVLALNFSQAVWVRAEVGQLKESRGHFYFNLVQKSEETDELLARSEAVLWGGKFRSLARKHGSLIHDLLREDLELLLQVQVEFHELYGFKLLVEDIDPNFTLGKLAIERQAILGKLKKKRLLEKNSLLPMPIVLQRIAVLSNSTAAGYHDFINQIKTNKYGHHYELELFPIALQGARVEEEILAQFEIIKSRKADFDCVVIIRGGGSKIDLASFDNFEVGKTIANFKLPVFTGIGHEIDEGIADFVAHTALKTPTAVAEFIVSHNGYFEEQLVRHWLTIREINSQVLNNAQQNLEIIRQNIKSLSEETIRNQKRMLDYIEQEIPRAAKGVLKTESSKIDNLEKLCKTLSPEQILKRGYSITTKDGKVIKNSKDLKKGAVVKTILKKGSIQSKVQ